MADNAGGQGGHDGGSPAEVSAPYAVGYGKPPKHTRFKPGQSGNPSGRRRAPRSLVRDLVDVLHEPVMQDEGAGCEVVTKQYSILRALAAKAMEGDPKAIAQVVRLSQWISGFTPAYYFTAPLDWDTDGDADGTGEGDAGENSLPPGKNRE